MLAIFFCYLLAVSEGVVEILFDGENRIGFVETGATFEMEEKGAKIKIDRSNRRDSIVREKALGMNESVLVFVNFNSRADQLSVIGARGKMNVFLVGGVRGDDANVHAAFRAKLQG